MQKTIAIALAILASTLIACGKGTTISQLTGGSSSGGGAPTASTGAMPTATSASTSGSSGPVSAGAGTQTQSAASGGTPIERVVQQLQPSVVRVDVSGSSSNQGSGPFGRGGGQPVNSQGTGTGMVLDAQGHILTNNHVVTLEGSATAQSVTVDLPNGKSMPAKVVGTDPQTDLAVIQVNGDGSGLTPIQWADPNSIRVGEQVVAIGYALDLGGAPTVTTGVVSALDRSIPEADATISGAIQTDAAVNPGNSGGPLLDLNGKVIGVTTAGLSGTSDTPVQGVNFVISGEMAQPVVQALISQGHVTRGYMGVAVTDITPELAQANGIGVDHGAGIGQVTNGAPADQAGLKPGDVITKVGDVSINNTGDLTNALTKYGPNQKVTVAYERGKNQATANITLGQRPPSG